MGGGGCLVCLIVWVVKLLTGFEAFGPPAKYFVLGSHSCLLGGASVVQILLALFSEQYTKDVLKRYVISTFCAVDRVDLVYSLKASTREKEETTPTSGSVHQITV